MCEARRAALGEALLHNRRQVFRGNRLALTCPGKKSNDRRLRFALCRFGAWIVSMGTGIGS